MLLSKQIATRVTEGFHRRFARKVGRNNRSSDILREILQAYVENRLVITPKPTKRKKS